MSKSPEEAPRALVRFRYVKWQRTRDEPAGEVPA
jgi:hypothetical protein